jgi:hypothetical protein
VARRHPLYLVARIGTFLHVFAIPSVFFVSSSTAVRYIAAIWYLVGFFFWGWLIARTEYPGSRL